MKFFRCPTCGEPRDVRVDRNKKYYIICEYPCGAQLFVRRAEGMRLMEALMVVVGKGGQRREDGDCQDLLFED